jgi:sugar/nucleoside kinase (ribokinase family)
MVDYAGYVSDDFLQDVLGELNQEKKKLKSNGNSNEEDEEEESYKKGDRVIVSVDQLGSVLNKLDSTDFKVTTGGSLSNTLVALSRLGGAGVKAKESSPNGPNSNNILKVGMAGLVGSDPVGSFYRAKMDRAGVEFLSDAAHSTTGTVIVLTTPDAQRTMLSHFPQQTGAESSCMLTPQVVNSIVSSRVLLVEGYLWECGSTVIASLMEAMRVAQENGALVCMTLSDTSVVNTHFDSLWEVLRERRLVDIVFANSLEAQALTKASSPKSAALALAQHTRVVSCVTDGHRGSHVAGMGACQVVPPYWMPKGPLDTCGAGDAYAAGALYALLRGASIRGMGYSGARVSSTVISQRGARLKTEDADKLVEVLPLMMYETTKLVTPEQQQQQQQHTRTRASTRTSGGTMAAEFESFP